MTSASAKVNPAAAFHLLGQLDQQRDACSEELAVLKNIRATYLSQAPNFSEAYLADEAEASLQAAIDSLDDFTSTVRSWLLDFIDRLERAAQSAAQLTFAPTPTDGLNGAVNPTETGFNNINSFVTGPNSISSAPTGSGSKSFLRQFKREQAELEARQNQPFGAGLASKYRFNLKDGTFTLVKKDDPAEKLGPPSPALLTLDKLNQPLDLKIPASSNNNKGPVLLPPNWNGAAGPSNSSLANLLNFSGQNAAWVGLEAGIGFAGDVLKGLAVGAWDFGKSLVEMGQAIYKVSTFNFDPLSRLQAQEEAHQTLQFLWEHPAEAVGQLWSGLSGPYTKAWNEGHPGEALGRGIFDIASLFVGAGEAKKTLELGQAVSESSKLALLSGFLKGATDEAVVAAQSAHEAALLGDVTTVSAAADKAGKAAQIARQSLQTLALKTEDSATLAQATEKLAKAEAAARQAQDSLKLAEVRRDYKDVAATGNFKDLADFQHYRTTLEANSELKTLQGTAAEVNLQSYWKVFTTLLKNGNIKQEVDGSLKVFNSAGNYIVVKNVSQILPFFNNVASFDDLIRSILASSSIDAYYNIRVLTEDIDQLSRLTGLTDQQILLAKQNLMFDEHLLVDENGHLNQSRFVPHEYIAELWMKAAKNQKLTQEELNELRNILQHENAEGQYLQEMGQQLETAFEKNELENLFTTYLKEELKWSGARIERLLANEPKPMTPYRFAHLRVSLGDGKGGPKYP